MTDMDWYIVWFVIAAIVVVAMTIFIFIAVLDWFELPADKVRLYALRILRHHLYAMSAERIVEEIEKDSLSRVPLWRLQYLLKPLVEQGRIIQSRGYDDPETGDPGILYYKLNPDWAQEYP